MGKTVSKLSGNGGTTYRFSTKKKDILFYSSMCSHLRYCAWLSIFFRQGELNDNIDGDNTNEKDHDNGGGVRGAQDVDFISRSVSPLLL